MLMGNIYKCCIKPHFYDPNCNSLIQVSLCLLYYIIGLSRTLSPLAMHSYLGGFQICCTLELLDT